MGHEPLKQAKLIFLLIGIDPPKNKDDFSFYKKHWLKKGELKNGKVKGTDVKKVVEYTEKIGFKELNEELKELLEKAL